MSWSAPKAMEHGLMQPHPIESRPKDVKRKVSWVGVAGLQMVLSSSQDEGLNCGNMDVSHRKTIPCGKEKIINSFYLRIIRFLLGSFDRRMRNLQEG